MSKRRLVITAVLTGQSQSQVARTYGVSQGWISRLMARYRAEGQAAFEPRSRAPKTSPNATPDSHVTQVLQLRTQLSEAGLDAGADTIGWHLSHHHDLTLSRATINRILVRHGTVTPEPAHRATPATIYTTRPKATPTTDRSADSHDRVRRDRVDTSGKITLRHQGRLYSIGIGRTHARTRVIVLIQDLHIQILDAATGEIIRELILDPAKRYQGTGRPPGPIPK